MESNRMIEILEQIKKTLLFSRSIKGLCETASYLLFFENLNREEYHFILNFIFENKPSSENEYKEFTQNEYWVNSGYWWSPMWKAEATRQIRIDYITKLISNIK